MSKPIFYQLVIIDNQDPLMLGRVRAKIVIDNYEDIIRAFDDPPWNEQQDAWSDRDPFIFNPLLPYFVYQVPKVNELCQAIYLNRDFKYQNQYYVQNTFFSPTSSFFQYYQGGNKFTGTGMQIKGPNPLRNKADGSYTNQGIHYGVFPEPGDNAILGRGSADLVVKENEVLLRAGKFLNSKLEPNVIPTANPQRAFLQLTRFPNVKTPQDPKKYITITEKTLLVKYLIEWVITNPENTQDKFCGAVYLYQLKADESTNSKNLTVGSYVAENLKKLVHLSEFTSLSKTDTINFINNFIQTCNNSNVTREGVRLFPSVNPDKFPIFYRPSPITYSVIQPIILSPNFQNVPNPLCPSGPSGPEFENVTSIFNNIKLDPALKQGGYGLIYVKNQVGTPTNTETTIVPQDIYSSEPITYGALGADKIFLLTHAPNTNPGKKQINFDGTLYGIPNETFSDQIIPNTSSMVRGEELLELINLITRFLLTHTHAFPGLPPVSVTQDGTTANQILTELQDAVNKILNENIRIN